MYVPTSYTVHQGDTVGSLAQQFGVSRQVIIDQLEANDIKGRKVADGTRYDLVPGTKLQLRWDVDKDTRALHQSARRLAPRSSAYAQAMASLLESPHMDNPHIMGESLSGSSNASDILATRFDPAVIDARIASAFYPRMATSDQVNARVGEKITYTVHGESFPATIVRSWSERPKYKGEHKPEEHFYEIEISSGRYAGKYTQEAFDNGAFK